MNLQHIHVLMLLHFTLYVTLDITIKPCIAAIWVGRTMPSNWASFIRGRQFEPRGAWVSWAYYHGQVASEAADSAETVVQLRVGLQSASQPPAAGLLFSVRLLSLLKRLTSGKSSGVAMMRKPSKSSQHTAFFEWNGFTDCRPMSDSTWWRSMLRSIRSILSHSSALFRPLRWHICV